MPMHLLLRVREFCRTCCSDPLRVNGNLPISFCAAECVIILAAFGVQLQTMFRRRWLMARPSYPKIKLKKDEGERDNWHVVQLLKRRGQHLLTNSRVLNAIVATSNINPRDTVLEIGPGTGNLTLKLLQVAKKVVAIKIDKRMVDILGKRATQSGPHDLLNLICGDASKTEFPDFNLVVVNIPYGIYSPLLANLVFGSSTNPVRSATLLLQKEFAKRLLVNHGDSKFNRLAVNMKLLADVEFVS